MSQSVPILMYHRVTPDDMSDTRAPFEVVDAIRVSPEAFEQQMNWLSSAGYKAISLDDLYDARMNQRLLSPQSIVITFDDGYQDFVDYAVPVLLRHGFTAHNFLVSGLVGQHSEWDREKFGIRVPMFDWDAARALERQGFRCDAHSYSHAELGSLGPAQSRKEILESRDRLRDELGREIVHFAYPYGSFNEQTQDILQDLGFKTACSVIHGRSGVSDNLFALRRICIHNSDSLLDFKVSVVTGVPVRKGLARRAGKLSSLIRTPGSVRDVQ